MRPGPPQPALLGGVTATIAFAIDIYLPALPTVARDLHTTTSAVQLTLTSLLAGMAVGQLVGGSWSDSVGRRKPVLVGLVGFVVASLLCAVAPSVEFLIAMRFAQGVAGSLGAVAARAAVRDMHEGDAAARMFARLMLVMGLAPVVAPLVGSAILTAASWRVVFVLLALGGTGLTAAAWRGLGETLAPRDRRPGGLPLMLSSFTTLLHCPRYLLIAFAGGLGYAGLFAYLSGSSFVLQDRYGLSPSEYAVAFAVNGVGFVVASQIGGFIVPFVGARRLLLLGGLMQVLGGLSLVSVGFLGLSREGAFVGFFLIVTSVGLIPPNSTALALADQGAHAGAAVGLLGLISQVCAAVVAPVVGIGDEPSVEVLSLVVLVCGAGGLICAAGAVALHIRDTRGPSTAEVPLG